MWARVKLKIDWSDIVFTTISGMRGGDVDVLQRDLVTFLPCLLSKTLA